MDIFLISKQQVSRITETPVDISGEEFLWLDATHDEVAADVQSWRNAVEEMTGVHIYDPHLLDITNLSHPSYFDSTQDYALVVFRKLDLNGQNDPPALPADDSSKRKVPPALAKLATKPVTFLLIGRTLITVHAARSRTVEATRNRLLDYKHKRDGGLNTARPPVSPEELMLRLLNAMVDQYLELRQPLTAQIDRWQHALLNPRRPFNDWLALLDARIELRKLDHLCEGQFDALQELRDYVIDVRGNTDDRKESDLLLVRVNDVIEHISRVLNHARRLESSIESAVQIHFSLMAHRTSEIMRTLTVITALFMPLTLITGIFGMNFDYLPLLKDRGGFWITIGAMLLLVVVMLLYFRQKRYLEDRAFDNRK
ncbi:magnesium transporter CorA family protein [Noviherbaspirillum sp.]|uniref:magnesium transporter CorA family protein n=1 Tax=Noviherbaspirillum sp. TaxID=1926288 RepID=UPI002FE1930C